MLLVVKCEGCGVTLRKSEVSDPGAQAVITAAMERARAVGAENWSVTPSSVVEWAVCDECFACEAATEVAIY